MFTTAAAGASNTRGKPRIGRAVQLHRRTSRVRELPETFGELPGGRHGRGDGHPRRGPDPRPPHRRRQPRALHAELGPPRRGARRPRVHGGGRHLRQRDHAPRRRDPAGARPRCRRATTTWPCSSSRCATPSNYSEPVLPARPGPARRVGGAGPPRPRAPGRRGDRRSGAGRRPDDHLAWCRGAWPTRRARSTAATSTRSSALLAPRRGPERILDFLLRTGPYGEGFGADPDGSSLDKLLANPHGVDHGALKPRLPDVLRTPDGMIALAPELLLADVARLHDGLDGRRDHPFVLDRAARPAVEQLVDAQRVGAGEGQAPLHRPPAPRRRRRPRAGRRRRRHRPVTGGGGAGAGGGHRRHPSRAW